MRHQERLLILAGVFTMALGLSLTLNPNVLPYYGLALAVLACAAVPYLLHRHPAYTFSPTRMILPAALALAAPTVAHELGNGPLRLLAVFGPGALLYGLILGEYILIQPTQGTSTQLARLLLAVSAYGIALGYYLLIYQIKERSVESGPLAAIISGALALRLLTLDRPNEWRARLYAAAAGLALAEVWWPLNYWVLNLTAGGLMLLLALYVLVGIMRQLLAGQFSQAIALEYGTVSLAGLLLVFGATRL
ncbi:MAG TPA: hypothetical protein VK009_20255 [Chloroflexota bacterium]|nr:hypothetical protein [Chloroflexota bacterium]